MARMMVNGSPATAPRMLLLNRVEFEPGCYVFELDQPLFLNPGDQIWAEPRKNSVSVRRAVTGAVERPVGTMNSELRVYKLL